MRERCGLDIRHRLQFKAFEKELLSKRQKLESGGKNFERYVEML